MLAQDGMAPAGPSYLRAVLYLLSSLIVGSPTALILGPFCIPTGATWADSTGCRNTSMTEVLADGSTISVDDEIALIDHTAGAFGCRHRSCDMITLTTLSGKSGLTSIDFACIGSLSTNRFGSRSGVGRFANKSNGGAIADAVYFPG